MDQGKCQLPKFGSDEPLSTLLTQHLQGFLEYSPDGNNKQCIIVRYDKIIISSYINITYF